MRPIEFPSLPPSQEKPKEEIITETIDPKNPEFSELHQHCVEMYKLKRIATGDIPPPEMYIKFKNNNEIVGTAGLFFAGPGEAKKLLPCEEWFGIDPTAQHTENMVRSEVGRLSFHEGVKTREILKIIEKVVEETVNKSLGHGASTIYFDTHQQIIRLFEKEIKNQGLVLEELENQVNPDKLPEESKDFAEKQPKLYRVDISHRLQAAA